MGPITGKLLDHVTPKVTLLIGFGAFGIGGILGAVVDNVFYVAAMRAVAGIGMGMVNVRLRRPAFRNCSKAKPSAAR